MYACRRARAQTAGDLLLGVPFPSRCTVQETGTRRQRNSGVQLSRHSEAHWHTPQQRPPHRIMHTNTYNQQLCCLRVPRFSHACGACVTSCEGAALYPRAHTLGTRRMNFEFERAFCVLAPAVAYPRATRVLPRPRAGANVLAPRALRARGAHVVHMRHCVHACAEERGDRAWLRRAAGARPRASPAAGCAFPSRVCNRSRAPTRAASCWLTQVRCRSVRLAHFFGMLVW